MMPTGEIIRATTTVASIWDGREVMLSDELYESLKVRVGVLTLTNSQNKKVIYIPISECISNAWIVGSPTYANLGKQEGGASVVIPKSLADALALQPGAQVELTNELSLRDITLWKCGEDKTNKFGSSWMIHKYVATAFFAGYEPNFKSKEQYPGIYLNTMQLENLNLNATLRPLCSLKKFKAIKENSPRAVGLVKIFYNNLVVEAAVYPKSYDLYPRAAIMVNAPLYQQLPDLQIGDPLQICSRFDVEDYKTAESLQSEPKFEQEPFYQTNDWLKLFLAKPSARDIFPDGFRNNLDDKLLLADILEDLTRNAKTLASEPLTLLKVINFMDSLGNEVTNTQEYIQLLQAVSKEEAILKEHQEQLFDLLTKELLNQKADSHNPPLLDALFTMGVNLKNGAGENCLHLMFRLGRGSCEASSSEKGYRSYPAFQTWMREKTPEGKTPLHYLCQQGDWKELLLIGKKLKKLNSDDFISPQGTPFHDLAEDLSEKFYEKYLTLSQIVKYQGMSCMKWFDQRDSNGLTPLEKMARQGVEPLIRFLLILEEVAKDDEDAKLNKEIFDQLLARLNIDNNA